MNFDLTEDQHMLRDQARRFLSETVGYDALRDLIATGADWDEALWRSLVELGWSGVAIAEDHGGLGLGFMALCVIAEELGRSVAPVPFLSSVGVTAELIDAAGSEERKSEILPAIAAGETIAALALFEGPGDPSTRTLEAMSVRAVDGRLNGRKWPVLDGGVADLLVVLAKDEADALGLYLVSADAAGVTRERLPGFDQLRPGYSIDFRNAACTRLSVADIGETVQGLFDRVAVLTAFEQIGGAEAALYMARDYALERRAFGRAIGSYQAIKHKLADMLTKIELARSAAYYAAWAMENDAADRAVAAATARIAATEAFEFASRENMQVHGGISFTWEANCHFYYRRSRLLATAIGDAGYWSDRVIDGLLALQPAGKD